MSNKTKRRKIKRKYRVDLGFYSYETTVSATSAGEARKLAIAKLQTRGLRKVVNPHTTFVERED